MIKWVVLICVASLSAGYYLQFVEHLIPCLLCIAQRFAFMGVIVFSGLFCLLSRHKIARGIGYVGMLISCGFGLMFAGKQLYLESLPIELRPACTIPFQNLIQQHDWNAAAMMLMHGTSDCGTRQWVFLNMSLPFWSGCLFALIVVMILANLLLNRKS